MMVGHEEITVLIVLPWHCLVWRIWLYAKKTTFSVLLMTGHLGKGRYLLSVTAEWKMDPKACFFFLF